MILSLSTNEVKCYILSVKETKFFAATWRPGSKVGLLCQLRKANSEQADAVGVNTGRGGSKPPPYGASPLYGWALVHPLCLNKRYGCSGSKPPPYGASPLYGWALVHPLCLNQRTVVVGANPYRTKQAPCTDGL